MSGNSPTLDTSDVDKYIGQAVGGGQLKDPFHVMDIKRWVQALDYYNPRHFDEEAAARTSVGEIIAPQSFVINCDVGHGSVPAITGNIPGSHVVFGGDEFWFYGSHILPADKFNVERRFVGYKLTETKFAGPTMFSFGDTLYFNQRKEGVFKQRSTMVRYLAELARERGVYNHASENPEYSAEQLKSFAQMRNEWIQSGSDGKGPGDVKVGDRLTPRAIGPNTITSFTMEQVAFNFNTWGSHVYSGHYHGLTAGWIPEMMDGDSDDPAAMLGMDQGPASGHTNIEKAKLIGMPRHYGYGSTMGAWVLDYLAYWAGNNGYIRHAKIDYRSPVFEGDTAFLTGEVTDFRFEPLFGVEIAEIEVKMKNQDNTTIATAKGEVELNRI